METFYTYDGIGSVANLTSAKGVSTQTYAYDAFGNRVAPTGTSANDNQFLTKETDSSGLIYFGARYYDPKIGRFITPDPLGMVDGPNVYLYCNNDPEDFIDPDGFWYIDINLSGGWWGGGTTGILIGGEGIYTYEGGGFVTPGGGGSITWSPQSPSTGWNVGLQGSFIVSGQVGYSFKDRNKFWEVGVGASYPTLGGASATAYYVHEPWRWPWNKKQEKEKCK